MRKFLVSAVLLWFLPLSACGYSGTPPPPNSCMEGEMVGLEWDGDRQYDLDDDDRVNCKITDDGKVIWLDDTEWGINNRPGYVTPTPSPATTQPASR